MRNQTVLVVAAHSAATEIAARHLPLWRDSGCHLSVTFSDHIPSDFPDYQNCREVGPFGYEGAAGGARMRALLNHALRMAFAHDATQAVISEYDWICVRPPPLPPPIGHLHAPVFANNDPRFVAPYFAHPAWRMSTETLEIMADRARHVPDDWEGGTVDRWISRVANESGVALFDDPLAYSRNKLDTPEIMAEAVACVKNGGWGVHGVTTPEQVEALKKAAQKIPPQAAENA